MSITRIDWADAVWNPVTGCTPVSAGCENCYAARMSKRLAGRCGYPKDEPFAVTLHPDRIAKLKLFKPGSRVFVNSMSDLFHPEVPFAYLKMLWVAMAGHDSVTFMILTKRPARMLEFSRWLGKIYKYPFVTSNIWLGVSVEDQQTADERIPLLLQTPALRFISVEPMLGAINFRWAQWEPWINRNHLDGLWRLDWVICGGETGPGARPVHPACVRSMRDQCKEANVPFFFKGWGAWWPAGRRIVENSRMVLMGDEAFYRVGKVNAGHLLDGQEHRELPR